MRLKEDICMFITLTCLFLFSAALFVNADDSYLNSKILIFNTNESGAKLDKHKKDFRVLLHFDEHNFNFDDIRDVNSFVGDLCFHDNKGSYYGYDIEEINLSTKTVKIWLVIPLLMMNKKLKIEMCWERDMSKITNAKQRKKIEDKKAHKQAIALSKNKMENSISDNGSDGMGIWRGNGLGGFKIVKE